MLRKLTVENFFSINESQTLDLAIAKNATDPDGRFATPIKDYPNRFPKVVTLFGANASGKTNVLRAITFLQQFMRKSVDWPSVSKMHLLSFNAHGIQEQQEPTKFMFVFDAPALSGAPGRSVYNYELEIQTHENLVLREVLKHAPEGKQRRLFERTQTQMIFGKEFPVSKRDPAKDRIRPDASVISTLAKFNHPAASMIINIVNGYRSNVTVSGKHAVLEEKATEYYDQNRDVFDRLNSEIKRFDLGIQNVVLNSTADGVRPFFQHKGLGGLMDFAFESGGTQTFYNLFPLIAPALNLGGVAVLDELDADIHPLLLPELVKMFQDKETNPRDAQLIMSCHNATLFEHLEKEEVYFTEKDSEGRTEVYGLKDIQGVRRDTNIYAKYLMGAFGAVPQIS